MVRITVGLKGGNQGAQSRREDNQVTSSLAGSVGVGNTGGHEHRFSRSHSFGSVRVAEPQVTFEHVPGFVVGMVNVESVRAAASPLVNLKRFPYTGKRRVFHAGHNTTYQLAAFIGSQVSCFHKVADWQFAPSSSLPLSLKFFSPYGAASVQYPFCQS